MANFLAIFTVAATAFVMCATLEDFLSSDQYEDATIVENSPTKAFEVTEPETQAMCIDKCNNQFAECKETVVWSQARGKPRLSISFLLRFHWIRGKST